MLVMTVSGTLMTTLLTKTTVYVPAAIEAAKVWAWDYKR